MVLLILMLCCARKEFFFWAHRLDQPEEGSTTVEAHFYLQSSCYFPIGLAMKDQRLNCK